MTKHHLAADRGRRSLAINAGSVYAAAVSRLLGQRLASVEVTSGSWRGVKTSGGLYVVRTARGC